jgi:predicted nucleotidyltransferase
MVENKVIDIVKKYLLKVADSGIIVDSGVVFGSCAYGVQMQDSDIDLLVISPDFDGVFEHKLVDRLWSIRRFVDSHIEPHAVGLRQFIQDTESPLIGIARQEGVIIPFSSYSVVAEKCSEYNVLR